MLTLFTLFTIVAVPILFFMLTWVVITAYRLFFPEETADLDLNPTILRRQATEQGVTIPVGVREIREDQRHQFVQHADATYFYAHGDSEGLPLSWFEDLHDRRN